MYVTNLNKEWIDKSDAISRMIPSIVHKLESDTSANKNDKIYLLMSALSELTTAYDLLCLLDTNDTNEISKRTSELNSQTSMLFRGMFIGDILDSSKRALESATN